MCVWNSKIVLLDLTIFTMHDSTTPLTHSQADLSKEDLRVVVCGPFPQTPHPLGHVFLVPPSHWLPHKLAPCTSPHPEHQTEYQNLEGHSGEGGSEEICEGCSGALTRSAKTTRKIQHSPVTSLRTSSCLSCGATLSFCCDSMSRAFLKLSSSSLSSIIMAELRSADF